MTQGRCDYVDSMLGGSLKQVNLLAGAAWTPGARHSLPKQPLIMGDGRGDEGGLSVSQTHRSASWQDAPSNVRCVPVQGTSFKMRVAVILMCREREGRRPTMKVAPIFECLVQMKASLFLEDCHIRLIFLESGLSY